MNSASLESSHVYPSRKASNVRTKLKAVPRTLVSHTRTMLEMGTLNSRHCQSLDQIARTKLIVLRQHR